MNDTFFSFIIPYYSGHNILNDLINSMQRSDLSGVEVIIVNDGTESLDIQTNMDNCKVIKNPVNCGYAASLNNGYPNSHGKYLILSNSDIILPANTIDKIRSFLNNNPDLDVISFPLINKCGFYDRFSKRYLPKMTAFIYWGSGSQNFNLPCRHFYKDPKKSELIECGKGAFIVVKRTVYEILKGFDPNYWMFWEDVDFFLKCKGSGINVIYNSDIPVIHIGSQTVKTISLRANLGELRSRSYFFRKWFGIPKKITILFDLFNAVSLFFINAVLLRKIAFSYYPRYISGVLKLLC